MDETSITEIEAIVKQTTADAAIKGVVITSSKDAFCAGADLSMLEGMNHTYQQLLKDKGARTNPVDVCADDTQPAARA